jgi:Ca-activated chloride channel homolog
MTLTRRSLVWFVSMVALTVALALVLRRYAWNAPEEGLSLLGGSAYVLRSPRLLGLLLVAPFLLFVLSRSLADLPWQQRALSLVARIAFVSLLAVSLARVARTSDTDKVCTVFLVDVSDSVSDEAIADAKQAVHAAVGRMRKDDVAKIVTFARRPRVLEAPAHPDAVPDLARHDTDRATHFGGATNAQAALELAYGLYPPGYLRRTVILSDGLETDGDLLAEANRARRHQVTLFAIPYKRPAPAEVAVQALHVPDRIKVGEPFEVRADVYASRKAEVRAELFQGETINGLGGVRTIDLGPGQNEVKWSSVVRVAGEVTYRLVLAPIGGDKFPENNEVAVTVDVPGRPSVIYVEGEAGRSTPLASALERQGFDVDARSPAAFPGSLKELERFDFLILSDVPADRVSEGSQALIESYLRDLGGGFLFAGGPNGYGPGGWQHTTVERILPVKMDAELRKDMPSVAMALVIDRSGSMTGLPLEMAKQAARATVDALAADDLVEVIAYDSVPTRYVKVQPARNRSRIESDIARIQAGGGTEIFPALDAAYQDMSVVQARKKHVILLTDGRASSSGIRDLVQAMAAESITVTTVGLGGEVDDQLLSMIKDFGGGRYHKAPDPNSLPKIFTREAELVAKSAVTVDYFPVKQTGPADFLRGIDIATAPLLGGCTSTRMRQAPAQQILVDPDRGDPILARWRVGLGWSLAWTSDVKARWAAEWTRWAGWPQFWGQLVHEHMRQKRRNELEMKTEVVASRVRAIVDAFTPDDRFENGLEGTLVIDGPAGGDKRKAGAAQRTVALAQTAPGRYEAEVTLDRYGSFLLRAYHNRVSPDGKITPVAVSYGHVSNPYPPEYASFEPNLAVLARAAAVTGGVMDPDPGAAWDPSGEKVTFHQDLWPRLVAAAIAVLLLDLLLRRVRLFDRKFLPKVSAP